MAPDASHSRPRRRTVLSLGIALIAIGVVTTAFVKHKDEDNQFCVSCHLHQEHMDGMTKMPAGTLAAAHHAAQDGSGHPERCFTCHSGEGVVGWTQVTVLSAWDAGRWVLGDRHEPTTMRLPITSQACLKCHADDLRKLPRDETKFHGLSDHRRVGIPCVSCHRVHDAGPKNNDFLDNANVRTQCQRCHRDLEEF